MPGDALDEHEPLDEIRAVERELQAQPTAHGVADVRGVAAARADRRRGRLEVETLRDFGCAGVDVVRASRATTGSHDDDVCVNP